MRKLTYLFLAAVMLCATGVAAGETSLLPDQFGTWQAEGLSKITTGPGLTASDGPDPRDESLREAGLTTIEQRRYRSGGKEINLNLYLFKDPTGAYQYFTQTTSTRHRDYGIGEEAAFDARTGNILVGNLVVSVGSETELNPEELAGLDKALQAKADHAPYPPLRTYAPSKDRVFGTQKYAAGPVGFQHALEQLSQGAYRELAKEIPGRT